MSKAINHRTKPKKCLIRINSGRRRVSKQRWPRWRRRKYRRRRASGFFMSSSAARCPEPRARRRREATNAAHSRAFSAFRRRPHAVDVGFLRCNRPSAPRRAASSGANPKPDSGLVGRGASCEGRTVLVAPVGTVPPRNSDGRSRVAIPAVVRTDGTLPFLRKPQIVDSTGVLVCWRPTALLDANRRGPSRRQSFDQVMGPTGESRHVRRADRGFERQ